MNKTETKQSGLTNIAMRAAQNYAVNQRNGGQRAGSALIGGRYGNSNNAGGTS